MMIYDVIVVGAGLMGSAAARHLADMGVRVALVGPAEPVDKVAHDGVFASHYDAARITRKLDSRQNWARFSQAAIGRYAQLEKRSGHRFFAETGAIIAGPETGEGADFIAKVKRNADVDGISYKPLRGAALKARFPYFNFPDGILALHEPDSAGWPDPRAHVQAEIAVAQASGAVVHRVEVTQLIEGDAGVKVHCSDGQVLNGDRAIVACGAFSKAAGLLPDPVPLKVYARTIVFFEMDEAEAARLKDMPSVVYIPPDLVTDPYILPPVRYPDGKMYIKIGGDPVDYALDSGAEIKDWFRTDGDPKAGAYISDQLLRLMPDLSCQGVSYGSCVTAFTPHNNPLIYPQSDRLIALTGGNGAGAKCADELGRLGALVAMGEDIPTDRYDGSFSV